MKKQKGFSLIELLIVVGIIGALTAIAVPAYQEHSKKSEATAGVAVLKSLLTNIDLHIQADDFPADTEWNSIGASKTMSALGEMTLTPADDTKYGELKLVFGDESVLKTKTVTYTKTANGWTCEQNSDVKIKSCAEATSSNSPPPTPPQGG